MREIRLSGSEGGVAREARHLYPYQGTGLGFLEGRPPCRPLSTAFSNPIGLCILAEVREVHLNKLFISLVVVFVVVAGALVFQASQEGTSTVILPSELASSSANPRSRIRVAGRVAALPVEYKVEPSIELKFNIEDPGSGTVKRSGTVPVVYNGIKPDMFATGRDVIIDGDFNGGTLTANKLLTQCPSKYEPPSVEKMYE